MPTVGQRHIRFFSFLCHVHVLAIKGFYLWQQQQHCTLSKEEWEMFFITIKFVHFAYLHIYAFSERSQFNFYRERIQKKKTETSRSLDTHL